MLKRLLAVAMLSGLLVVVAGNAPAAADNCHDVFNKETGQFELVCDKPGGGGPGNPSPVGGGGTEKCYSKPGREIPCGAEGGRWNGSCYLSGTRIEPQPAPPAGKTPEDGAWYYCAALAGGVPGTAFAKGWIDNGTTLVDPAVLARRAVAAMDLDPIEVGIVPKSGEDKYGLVGLPTWMWVSNATTNTWGTLTRSASDGPLTVTATATATQVQWNMGDGTIKTCGKGTPYRESLGKQASPDCGHRYEKTSGSQPDNAYSVVATTHWEVQWSGGGQSGTITFDLASDPVQIRVGELQVLIQN